MITKPLIELLLQSDFIIFDKDYNSEAMRDTVR